MINTTHNCNLKCRMCLCGDAKNVKMSEEILHKAFIGVDSIGKLYLSGGEVLLYPSLIRILKNKIDANNVSVDEISITTNGTLLNDEAKEAILYLYDGIKSKELVVSTDSYHKDAINDYIRGLNNSNITFNDYIQNAYDFCNNNGISFVKSIIDEDLVLKMGRAKNMESAIEADNKFYALRNYSPKTHHYTGYVGITANGFVVRCDYENDNIESLSIGNVLNSSIEEIIYNRCVEELKQERTNLDYTDIKTVEHVMEYVFRQK